MRQQQAEKTAIIVAGAVIGILTVAAFWLSYAHLADVANRHGLAASPMRRWAWPATLDLFILAGEVLMFLAALRKSTDWWAVVLTVAGSVGSIGLNVAGVGPDAPVLDYVVAAVPPTAALLAFGALMRQVHGLVAEPAQAPEPAPIEVDRVPEPTPEQAPGPDLSVPDEPVEIEPPAPAPEELPAPITEPEPVPVVEAASPAPVTAVPPALVAHAQKIADGHQATSGSPIDSATLRARLGVPAPLADALVAQLA